MKSADLPSVWRRSLAGVLAVPILLALGLAAPAWAQTARFSFTFDGAHDLGVRGEFTATEVRTESNGHVRYRITSLDTLMAGATDYSADVANYPPLSTADEFTWDPSDATVTDVENTEGVVDFYSDPNQYWLSLHILDKDVETTSILIHNTRSISESVDEETPTTTLTRLATATATLDVDGNGTVGLLTDGLLLVRYLIDIRGSALTNLALADNAHADRDTHEEIAAYLQGLVDDDVLDVDGNGTVGLLTDGLLIVRYLIDIRGPELTNLALASDAHEDRNEPDEIVAYLDSLVPPR